MKASDTVMFLAAGGVIGYVAYQLWKQHVAGAQTSAQAQHDALVRSGVAPGDASTPTAPGSMAANPGAIALPDPRLTIQPIAMHPLSGDDMPSFVSDVASFVTSPDIWIPVE